MCLDFHPKRQHMIVAGLVCGNVAVFNLQLKTHKPSYISSTRNGKHTDIVWKVSVLIRAMYDFPFLSYSKSLEYLDLLHHNLFELVVNDLK